MADLALGVVTDIVKTGMAIKDAVETVRQNEEDCQNILTLVAALKPFPKRLHDKGLTSDPAMRDVLMSLNGSLRRALKLINKCQKRSAMHSFLTAGDMAKQLRRVHDDIQLQMQLLNLAIGTSLMEVKIEFTRTTIIRRDGALPLPTQPQGATEMEIYSSHSITGDTRSEETGAGIITTVTTETEAPSAPSSSNIAFSELSWSETVATHHLSEQNVRGGSDYTTTVIKQKIVIKVGLTSERHVKAMGVASRICGVESMAIVGDGRDLLEVVATGIDAVTMLMLLRKKLGYAEMLEVSEFDDTKVLSAMSRTGAEEEQHKPANRWTRTRSRGFGARIARWMWPRARTTVSLPPAPSPQRVEDTDAPEHSSNLVYLPATTEDDLFFAPTTTDTQLLQHQPVAPPAAARVPVRRRRHTFNMSRVHRSVRLPSTRRHPRITPRTQPPSSERLGARILQLLVSCAFCTLVLLLASVWALR